MNEVARNNGENGTNLYTVINNKVLQVIPLFFIFIKQYIGKKEGMQYEMAKKRSGVDGIFYEATFL